MFAPESQKLWHRIGTMAQQPGGYATLSDAERRYYVISYFNGEVYNGGLSQGFANSSGDYYFELIDFLAEANLFEIRDVIVAAKDIMYGREANSVKAMEEHFPGYTLDLEMRLKIDQLDKAYFAGHMEFLESYLHKFATENGLFDDRGSGDPVE